MSLIDWKDTYSVGIKAIDDQHRKIINLINELLESIRDSREDYIINEVLKDLTDYSNYHFTLEENILHKYSFKETHDHETKHREFSEKIETLNVGQNVHSNNIPRETLDYLENWFHDHELEVDNEYYKYLKTMGVLTDVEKLINEGKI